MNERFVKTPNLPGHAVTLAAVSGLYPEVPKALKALGIRCVETVPDPRLQSSSAHHADMQIFYLGEGRTFVARGAGRLAESLRAEGMLVAETAAEPTAEYPGDVLCNALYLKDTVFANLGAMDASIYGFLESQSIRTVHVNQGYARCSTAVVDEHSVITMDSGIQAAAQFCGLDALLIRERSIQLDGRHYGFIGGCCGLIDKDVLAFTGSLDSLDSGDRIRAFLAERGVKPLELTDHAMLDIGGILPLKERESL